MTGENKNVIIILLMLALFTGATIEISEGSVYVGIILFAAGAVLITQIHLSESTALKGSGIYLLTGLFIVIADLLYNYSRNSDLGTLDTMVFFLGISLIGCGVKNPQTRRMGEFGAYISGVFIVLFLIFYSLFGSLNIDFVHNFDHYFILLPTVAIMKLAGMPLEVIATETVRLSGAEEMTIVIGGPCSGLYSMFLLIGIVVGYSRIEKMDMRKTLYLSGFTIAVAYLSNLVRVIILYITAYLYGQETMMMVHTHVGWIIFAVVAGGIMYLMDLKR
ncbi:MAG: archaeosortase C [Methanosarcinaceae archaeon]|nr:archaeosortase C [Methanosarcinaceae archaeon]